MLYKWFLLVYIYISVLSEYFSGIIKVQLENQRHDNPFTMEKKNWTMVDDEKSQLYIVTLFHEVLK